MAQNKPESKPESDAKVEASKADAATDALPKFQFHSKFLGLRVNIRSPEIGRDNQGRRFVKKPGVSVKFTNGVFTTDDADLAGMLRKRAEEYPRCGYHEVNTSKIAEAKAA